MFILIVSVLGKTQNRKDSRGRMKTTMACCLECLKGLALISFPIIPTTAENLWKMLGYQDTILERGWKRIMAERIPQGQILPEPTILFQKIEDSQIEEEIRKLKKMSIQTLNQEQPSSTVAPLKSPVTIEDVRKLDLRIGVIRQAEPIPKSKKLLRLQVDIGLEQRTIVAGIGESYQAESLIGRPVVVVANLKPATLMGVQSEGMLLAAKHEGLPELILVEKSSPGSEVS